MVDCSADSQATPPQLVTAPDALPLSVDTCLIEGGSIPQQDIHSPLNSWVTHCLYHPPTAYWPPQGGEHCFNRRQMSTPFSHRMPHVDSHAVKGHWGCPRSIGIMFSGWCLLFFPVTVPLPPLGRPYITTDSCVLRALSLSSDWVAFHVTFSADQPLRICRLEKWKVGTLL